MVGLGDVQNDITYTSLQERYHNCAGCRCAEPATAIVCVGEYVAHGGDTICWADQVSSRSSYQPSILVYAPELPL